MQEPYPLRDDSFEAQQFNAMLAKVRSLRPMRGAGAQMRQTPFGMSRKVFRPRPQFPQLTETFHPFKIYAPNLAALPPWGAIYDQAGNPTKCLIDSTQPTNLKGASPTVNPLTDGWRIVGVRNGAVQYNSIYGLDLAFAGSGDTGFHIIDVFDYNQDFGPAPINRLHGTDGWGSTNALFVGKQLWQGYDGLSTTMVLPQGTNQFWGCPLIIDDGGLGISGAPYYAIWLEIENQSNQAVINQAVTVKGSSSGYWGNFNGPGTKNRVIPIGKIYVANPWVGVLQAATGHMIDLSQHTRYTNANLQPYMTDGRLTYIGDWQNDNVGNIPIQERLFLPGDVITYTDAGHNTSKQYNTSGAQTVTVTLNFDIEYLLMCVGSGTPNNPLNDPNWVIIRKGTKNLNLS